MIARPKSHDRKRALKTVYHQAATRTPTNNSGGSAPSSAIPLNAIWEPIRQLLNTTGLAVDPPTSVRGRETRGAPARNKSFSRSWSFSSNNNVNNARENSVGSSYFGDMEQVRSFDGPAVEYCHELLDVAHGGQTLITEAVWKEVHTRIPLQTQVLYLGTHFIHPESMNSHLIYEISPLRLSQRQFPALVVHRTLEPEFQNSPRPEDGVAIMFCQAEHPENLSQEQEEALARGVAQYSSLLRSLLRSYDGFECKEPDPGKFTLAFKTLHQAVYVGSVLQYELLRLEWEPMLLTVPRFREVWDESGEVLLHRGVRVSMGCAYGRGEKEFFRKPLSSGRPDYFGWLPNLAARILGQARPGQVVVEGDLSQIPQVTWLDEFHSKGTILWTDPQLVFKSCGNVSLKGISEIKQIYSVTVQELAAREFASPKSQVEVAVSAASMTSLPRQARESRTIYSLMPSLYAIPTLIRGGTPRTMSTQSLENSVKSDTHHPSQGSASRVRKVLGKEFLSQQEPQTSRDNLIRDRSLQGNGAKGIHSKHHSTNAVVGTSSRSKLRRVTASEAVEPNAMSMGSDCREAEYGRANSHGASISQIDPYDGLDDDL